MARVILNILVHFDFLSEDYERCFYFFHYESALKTSSTLRTCNSEQNEHALCNDR